MTHSSVLLPRVISSTCIQVAAAALWRARGPGYIQNSHHCIICVLLYWLNELVVVGFDGVLTCGTKHDRAFICSYPQLSVWVYNRTILSAVFSTSLKKRVPSLFSREHILFNVKNKYHVRKTIFSWQRKFLEEKALFSLDYRRELRHIVFKLVFPIV